MKKFVSMFLICSTVLLSACGGTDSKNTPDPSENTGKIGSRVAKAGAFAEWKEDAISYTPSVPAYTVEKDLSNVAFPGFSLTLEDKNLIADNHFLVMQSWNSEYFQIYESNRYANLPNFVTTDSVLHTYHLYFDYLLKTLEENELFDTAVRFSDEMIKLSEEQYAKLKGTTLEDAARRNLAYFAVAAKLLDSKKEFPAEIKVLAEKEFEQIEKHEGLRSSILFGTPDDEYTEDYSQYIPRGHYTKSEKLKRYFRALMWYGRMTFRLKSSDETASSLLIISALEKNPQVFAMWNTLFEPINFFVGEPDDLSFYDYNEVSKEVFGGEVPAEDAQALQAKIPDFMKKAADLRPPSINSMVLIDPRIKPNDRKEETMGFRVLGQRSTVDAAIFQKLIFRSVLENPKGKTRMLPKALDIPAVLGSKEALEILEDLGETDYAKYKENFAELSANLKKQPYEFWTKNLYFGWVNTLRALLNEYGEGYPAFMKNKNWKLKELITFLGSYTELKHDTILYAKQVYAELGGGPMEEPFDDRGYVEPNPELYNRMKSLIQLTIDGLSAREILSEDMAKQLNLLKELVTKLRDISIKELQNEKLTEEEYEFIRNYGGSLEHFWYETFSEEEMAQGSQAALNGSPAPIVADIATDPNGEVLEEGTGYAFSIYVIVPVEGKLKLARGSVFSHYEFPWPLSDRLTDEKWRSILSGMEDFQPELHSWTKGFTKEFD